MSTPSAQGVSDPSRSTLTFRILASGLVLALAWSLVELMHALLYRPLPEPVANEVMRRNEANARQAAPRPSENHPWPRFPASWETGRSRIVLNGVPVVEQTLVARASPERVLAFYRKTMRVRGWRNNTEEFYHIRPAALRRRGMPRNLQDENFLRRYDAVKRSKLSLVRGNESVLVEVRRAEKRRSRIDLHYVGASSLFDIAEQMMEAARDPRPDPRPLLTSRSSPGQPAANTAIYYSARTPEHFFRHLAHGLEAKGWTRAPLPASRHRWDRNPALEALFQRDDRVASLAVTPTGNHGSTAIVTQTER